jgi:DNA invertase Pin-like site-specific DNA recombinase
LAERQREGIAKAKADGKYKGRAPTARAKAEKVRELHASWHRRRGHRQAARHRPEQRLQGWRATRGNRLRAACR